MHTARVDRLLGCSALSRMASLALVGPVLGSLLGSTLVTGCTGVDGDPGTSSTEEALSATEVAGEESGACEVPGTLAYHVAQASAAGRFDYDPAGGLVERLKGRYRDRAGRFHWKERFTDDSYLEHRKVRGEAAAFGAQQSLAYQIETTDVLGAVSVSEVEESWDGCSVERRVRAQGATDWLDHAGSYDGTTYTYTEEQVPYRNAGRLPVIAVFGESYADGSFLEQFEFSGYPDYYQTRTGDGNGNEGLSWEINFGDAITYGFVETSVDGTKHHFTRQLSDGDGCTSTHRDFTVGYDGYGSGTSRICAYLTGPDDGEDNGEEEEEEEEEEELPVPVPCTLEITPTQCVETCAHGAVNVYASCL